MREFQSRSWRRSVGWFLWVGLLLAAGGYAQSTPQLEQEGQLQPDRRQAATLKQSLTVLERSHYNPPALDDGFATATLERYIAALDPARMVFLQADVDRFQAAYGTSLDEALSSSKLAPAFDIFQQYRTRRLAQLDFMLRQVEADFAQLDLNGVDRIERDRSAARWPRTSAEARVLWERVFKNDVLAERLADRSPEQISVTLKRRYEGQRKQLDSIKSEDVFEVFLNAVTAEFDPHTNYFPPAGAENFDMSMSLSFEGIGAVLGLDYEYAVIQSLIPGGPAERSGGLHPMDRILAVGQGLEGPLIDVVGWRLDDVVSLIRGPRGSAVALQVVADGDLTARPRTVVVIRDEVKLEDQAAKSEILDIEAGGTAYRVGVITLPTFYLDFDAARKGTRDYRSSNRDVLALLKGFESEGVDGIVLDLRDNGGGALSEAQSIAGLFLGPLPIVQVRSAEGRVQVLKAPTPKAYSGPLVVLVNRLSASASEIVAAAIQDHGRGVVVGSRTFGKGTVQGIVPLGDGDLKITEAKFYRVSGGSTQNLGVEPDLLLPSTYDPDEIGESSLPHALPYDRVRAVLRRTEGVGEPGLERLRSQHDLRASQDPNLIAGEQRLALARELEERQELSLNESVRRAERAAIEARLLKIENDRRVASGLEPVEELNSDEIKPDVELQEAARIAVDLVRELRASALGQTAKTALPGGER